MNALEWLSTTDKPLVRPVYAVYGDDSYLIRESIRAIAFNIFPDEEERESAISRFPGPTSLLADVLDEVSTLPFFARRRLVIVDDADPSVTKYRRDLEAYVAHPSESGTLVLQVKQWTATTKLAALVEKAGASINCTGPR
jgi:DNA polymerase III subunit delta